jgi:hypothetical protein
MALDAYENAIQNRRAKITATASSIWANWL